jgi:hypothetical protein
MALFKTHQWIKTVCTVYAGSQKDQDVKLIALPVGIHGQIRAMHTKRIDGFDAITYYLVKFPIPWVCRNNGKETAHYWAKISESCIVNA